MLAENRTVSRRWQRPALMLLALLGFMAAALFSARLENKADERRAMLSYYQCYCLVEACVENYNHKYGRGPETLEQVIPLLRDYESEGQPLIDGRPVNPYTGEAVRFVPLDQPEFGALTLIPMLLTDVYADGRVDEYVGNHRVVTYLPSDSSARQHLRTELPDYSRFYPGVYAVCGRGYSHYAGVPADTELRPVEAPLSTDYETLPEALTRLGYPDLANIATDKAQ